MGKGLHTQGAAVLFERLPSVDQVVGSLVDFPGVLRMVARGYDWMGGAPGVSLPLAADGRVVVHLFDRRWPDEMGDPNDDRKMLFGAWMLGFFGPFTFPNGLLRAAANAPRFDGAEAAVERHQAFARISTTYVSSESDPVMPHGYEPESELSRVTAVARAIGALPDALAYFNPNSEVLLAPDAVEGDEAAWMNIRVHRLPQAVGWIVMDTVGLWQLDVPDIEACFPDRGISEEEVERFLRGVARLLVRGRVAMSGGELLDGPGGRWRVWLAEAMECPPRRVLRIFPGTTPLPPPLWKGRG